MIKNNFFTALMFTTAMTTSAFCSEVDVTEMREDETLSRTSSIASFEEADIEGIPTFASKLATEEEEEEATEKKSTSELAVTLLYQELTDIIDANVSSYITAGMEVPTDSQTVAEKLSAMLTYGLELDLEYNKLDSEKDSLTIDLAKVRKDADGLSEQMQALLSEKSELEQKVADLTASKSKYKRIAADLVKKTSATGSKETLLKATAEDKDASTVNATKKSAEESVDESVNTPLLNTQEVEEVAEERTKYAFLDGAEIDLTASQVQAIRATILGSITGAKARSVANLKTTEALFSTLSTEEVNSIIS